MRRLAETRDADGELRVRDGTGELRQETMIINMGPQHPSTHGVLRLLLELDGETVLQLQADHRLPAHRASRRTPSTARGCRASPTSRAPTTSRRSSTSSRTASPVEKLLGIEAPPRAQSIRVLLCELNRIASHLVWLATGGMELGAVSVMLYGVPRARDDPRHLRGGHRPAHEPRVHPARRRDHGPASRTAPSKIARLPRRSMPAPDRRVRDAPATTTRSGSSATRASGILYRGGRARARRDRVRSCARPASRRTCARTSRTCGYETYEFDVPVRDRRRLLRALRGPDGGDARVAADRRAGARPARSPAP